MPLFPANVARQYPLVALLKISFTDLTNGSIVSGANIARALDLPNEYLIVDGAIYVETAFNGTTTTVAIGDPSSATRFAAAVSLQTAATTAFTGVPFHSGTIGTANLAVTFTGTPTTGLAWVYMRYLIPGRNNEVQPN